jgi:hypothetical protein
MADNKQREALWRERVELWRASGLSQRAFALKHGYPVRQMGYWVRRLAVARAKPAPALLPVEVRQSAAPRAALTLRGDSGWTMTLPAATPAAWLADLLRAL